MNHRLTRAIIWRDLRMLVANRAAVVPMVLLPIVFFAGLPLLVGVSPGALNLPVDDLALRTDILPAAALANLPADPEARLAVVLLVYLLAPLFLVVPLLLAIVAAAGAIAGERERRTLEILLLSPVTDRQLFLAKTVGAWLPAIAITFAGSVVYQLVANAVLAGTGTRPFPNLLWVVLILWVSPALGAAALGVVSLSARARTFQEALQLGSLLILPLVALVVAQATGLLALGALSLAAGGAVLWLLAAVLLPVGARAMRRDRLAAQI